jgi:hypothetical protein
VAVGAAAAAREVDAMIRSVTPAGSSLMGRWPYPGSVLDRVPGGSSPRLRDWPPLSDPTAVP